MINQIESKNIITRYIAAITISLFPILTPYKLLGPVSVGLVILILGATLCMFVSKKIYIYFPLVILVTVHSFLSVIALFSLPEITGTETIVWSIMVALLISFFIMQPIQFFDLEIFMKVLIFVSIIISAFLIYQLSVVTLGGIPHDGVIFEGLVDEDNWSNSYIRPNSFFSEPSYLAIYLLPIIVLLLNNRKYILALFFYVIILLSTSTLGIIGGFVILLVYMFLNKKVKLLFLTSGILLLLYFISIKYLNLSWLVEFNFNKTINIQERSQLRIFGYIEYFDLIPTFNQIIGVGFNQLGNFFKVYNLANYSNAFVLVLINFGIIGFVTYLLFIFSLFLKSNKEAILFVLILVLISLVDAFIYSANFYYILYFIFVYSKFKPFKIILKM